MTVNRTARGTASSKSSGSSLTIASFTVPSGHSLVICAGYDNGQGAPTSVIHSGRSLKLKAQRDDATNGFHASVWIKGEYHRQQTGTCVLTWASSIGKRAAVASSYDRAHKDDDVSSKLDAASTAPATGQTGVDVNAGSFVVDTWYEIMTVGTTDFTEIGAASNTVGEIFKATGIGSGTGMARSCLTSPDDLAVAAFISEGPSSDHASATADIENENAWESATIGQKAGTVGAPPISNITVLETFLNLTGRETARGRLQSATSRNWISILLAFEERMSINRQGITPSDIDAVDDIVEAAGGNTNDIYFGFDEDTGEWLAYETTTPGTLRATRDSVVGDWG